MAAAPRQFRRLGLQHARSGQRAECRSFATGLGLEHGARLSGRSAAGARRRAVPCQSEERRAALDGRSGDLLWEYRRELPKIEGGYHNDLFDRARGTIVLYDDKVLLATADAHIVALDAHTGKVIWDTTVADYRQGYTFTGGPLAAHGKVVAGISGCTNPGTSSGCFIVALDAKTGAEVWRTKTIAQPGSPGDDSWHGLPADKRHGGSVWTSGSYDPALNLVYWGTGGPIPHSEIVRGTGDGAVLYTNSTLALAADTGKIVWYHQFLPREIRPAIAASISARADGTRSWSATSCTTPCSDPAAGHDIQGSSSLAILRCSPYPFRSAASVLVACLMGDPMAAENGATHARKAPAKTQTSTRQ